MTARALRGITLLLTSDCNLRCAYCYENSKKKRRMEWRTLHAALELALTRTRSNPTIVFTGGEPLLEFPLVERGVAYARDNAPQDKRVRLFLVTNGLMLDENKIKFLTEHEVDVQLSFDGVRHAQNLRGKRTFDTLDRLLDVLAERHPRFFRRRLRVSMTVTPKTVRYLAESVEYFLRKRVERLEISPSIGDCSDWRRGGVKNLERQFSLIVTSSLRHFRGAGKIPLSLFRDGAPRNASTTPNFFQADGSNTDMCRATQGDKLAVDVDGDAFACATLVGSCQRFPSRLLRTSAKAMRIGNVRSKTFMENHTSFAKTGRRVEIFCGKEDKYSSYGRCRDCRYFAICGVCPVAIGHIPGNEDPNRVPDFSCAFNFTAGKYRERFWRRALSATGSSG